MVARGGAGVGEMGEEGRMAHKARPQRRGQGRGMRSGDCVGKLPGEISKVLTARERGKN